MEEIWSSDISEPLEHDEVGDALVERQERKVAKEYCSGNKSAGDLIHDAGDLPMDEESDALFAVASGLSEPTASAQHESDLAKVLDQWRTAVDEGRNQQMHTFSYSGSLALPSCKRFWRYAPDEERE